MPEDPQGQRRSFVRRPRPQKSSGAPRPVEQQEPAPRRQQKAGKQDGARERIVVPRQERGRTTSPLDVELREVRWGETTRGAYLRVVPSRQRFKRVAAGHIEATLAGSTPRGRFERAVQAVKGVLLGSPMAMAQTAHERLSKLKALAILGSDPLSSSAYATEEALLILAIAGVAGLEYLIPIGITVALLLILVTISYRQTIKAYPNGGGAYSVSHDNLGQTPGLIAAGALMVDYTLLVSVSVAAGVAAITSAIPDLIDYRIFICVGIIVVFTLGNLRGLRESGTLFAAPTYFFILMMSGTIIYGVIRVLTGDAPGSLTEAAPPDHPERLEELATSGVSLWLILRAFSAGASALTGVEAMANGVPSFKPPEATNARQTMLSMAAIGVFMFLGITFLSSRFGFVPSHEETLVSDMGRTILGENVLYYGFQAATALILFLAANTSFNAFPLLSAILARDRYMPRQFAFRGDRLAYSNGILLLAVIATTLLVIYDAQVTRLIPLYAVGVFIAFTLSQAGMVKHWWLSRGPGWHGSMALNLIGVIATGIVAVIIGATKFLPGAWISLLMIAVLVMLFTLVRRHYDWYERVISVNEDDLAQRAPIASPSEPSGRRGLAVITVDGINLVTVGAIDLARAITPNITAVHVVDAAEEAEEFRKRWADLIPDVPLLIIESPFRAFAAPVLAYIDSVSATGDKVTVILPAFKAHHWYERMLHNQAIRRLRPFLDDYPNVDVVEFDYDVRRPGAAGGSA
jgi:amino acid transporter